MRNPLSVRICMWSALLLVLQQPFSAQSGFVTEPSRRVPIVYEADVVVAGGGVSGVFAAIAAARSGARTVLVERYSSVTGTTGPGLNAGGGNQGIGPRENPRDAHVYPVITGLPKEFTERFDRHRKEHHTGAHRLADSYGINYLATRMLQEAGVQVLVSTWATDPILDGKTVKGVFIENKSGRGAVTAKVVIDATGEADVARRAGAPILLPKESYHEVDRHAPNGIGLFAYVGGIDWAEYLAALQEQGRRVRRGLSRLYDIEGLAQDRRQQGVRKRHRCSARCVMTSAALKVQLVRPHAKVDAGNGVAHLDARDARSVFMPTTLVQDCPRARAGLRGHLPSSRWARWALAAARTSRASTP